MHFLINWAINAVAVVVGSYLVPGVSVESWTAVAIAALVLAVVNTFIKPILVILTIPLTLITLGIFLLVLNVGLVLLVANVVPGFTISGFMAGFWFSVVLWLTSWIANSLSK